MPKFKSVEETQQELRQCGKADFKWVFRGCFDVEVTPDQARIWIESRCELSGARPGGKIRAQRQLGTVRPTGELLIRKDKHGGQIILTSVTRVSDEPEVWKLVDGQHRLSLIARGNTPVRFTVRLYHCSTEKDAAALFALANDGKRLQAIDRLKALWVNEHPTVCHIVRVFPSMAERNSDELAVFSRNWSGKHPNASQIMTAIHVALLRDGLGRSGLFDSVYNAGVIRPEDVDLFKAFWEQVLKTLETLPEDVQSLVRPMLGKVEALALLFTAWLWKRKDKEIIALTLSRIASNLEWRQKVKSRNPSKIFSQWKVPYTEFAALLYPPKSRSNEGSGSEMREALISYFEDWKATDKLRKDRDKASDGSNNMRMKIREALSEQDSLSQQSLPFDRAA